MSDLRFDNINEAQLYIINLLLKNENEIETRSFKTLECAPIFFSVTNPRKRITTLNSRHWNFAAALGELSWHLSVSNDVEFIATYLSGWKNYSADNEHITGSCYGFKIFNKNGSGKSNWDNIVSLLQNDQNSRRAIISLIDTSEYVDPYKPDISCTVSLQFLVRSGKVDLIVNMRSNDVIWGLPYDFFFFSYLQELMSLELGLVLGTYYHFAGSMHIYARHYDLGRRIIENNSEFLDLEMPHMLNKDIEEFLSTEHRIRTKEVDLKTISNLKVDKYWKSLLEVIYYYTILKNGGDAKERTNIVRRSYYSEIIKQYS